MSFGAAASGLAAAFRQGASKGTLRIPFPRTPTCDALQQVLIKAT
jgi:hypothetical protein